MIDWHVHIGLSNGMLPAEAIFQAAKSGCRSVGLILRTDGNFAATRELAAQIAEYGLYADINAVFGIELVHVPPALLPHKVAAAREHGVRLILVHGESLSGQTMPGTNFAAAQARVDILAHPGLVDTQTAEYAAENGVAFEISSCPVHALTNAHVAKVAEIHNVPLVLGSNAHSPQEMQKYDRWRAICAGAGISADQMHKIDQYSRTLAARFL